MITPTGNQRGPYSFYRQHNNNHSSFADLLAKSTANAADAQVQRSAVTARATEDKIVFTEPALSSRMARYEDLELVENGSAYYISEWDEYDPGEPKFPKSISDLSWAEMDIAMKDAKFAAGRLDMEGKTKTEIYNEVRGIYESYLGKDFEEPALLWNFWEDEGRMNRVLFGFHESLDRHGVDLGKTAVSKEVNGYGGMSDDEMRAAIRGKYPDNMTFKECLLMSIELDRYGLQKSPGVERYSTAIRTSLCVALGGWTGASMKIYNAMMDLPADYEAMKADYDALVKNDYSNYPTNNMEGVLERLLSITGGDASAFSGIFDMLTAMEKSGELTFNEYGFLWSYDV